MAGWLNVFGWFLLSGLSLFLAYPAASMLWKLGQAKIDYGKLNEEIRPIFASAVMDSLVVMMPIAVLGVPPGYVVIGVIPATVVMGAIYQRTHGEWPPLRPYLFALLSRMILIVEILLFIYSVAGVPR